MFSTIAAVAGNPDIESFYRAVATVSFTLLGLWWFVVNGRYAYGDGDDGKRRHAYGVALFFLLPGLISLVSSINGDLSLLWRVAFGGCAAIGILETAMYARTRGPRTTAAVTLRACGLVLYALMAAVAVRPELSVDLRLGLAPRELESILLALLLLVGAHLAWLGMTESSDTAGG